VSEQVSPVASEQVIAVSDVSDATSLLVSASVSVVAVSIAVSVVVESIATVPVSVAGDGSLSLLLHDARRRKMKMGRMGAGLSPPLLFPP
jgi:hypothetical protein